MPRRCALGCPPQIRGLLHILPNPNKYPEQHKAWVKIVTGNENPDEFDYKKYRVCDRHFIDTDRIRNHRLSVLAIPSLFLPADPLGMQSRSGSPPTVCTNLDELQPLLHRISIEHNYSVSAKRPDVRKPIRIYHNNVKPDATTYKIYQKMFKNIRRKVFRLRKRYQVTKRSLENAEKLLKQFKKV
ncbi:hypothetical protein RR46_08259 [Papilio xuthus]|uniref:THAP-type domain-containing protein n=1 Tax=Papilio xuthus TaxID=66420 RepID=A0A194PFN0_PAPXU|nr:hypothetical protein RR46_08259 [Papilio xuthus]